jgi:hypothetical protein
MKKCFSICACVCTCLCMYVHTHTHNHLHVLTCMHKANKSIIITNPLSNHNSDPIHFHVHLKCFKYKRNRMCKNNMLKTKREYITDHSMLLQWVTPQFSMHCFQDSLPSVSVFQAHVPSNITATSLTPSSHLCWGFLTISCYKLFVVGLSLISNVPPL